MNKFVAIALLVFGLVMVAGSVIQPWPVWTVLLGCFLSVFGAVQLVATRRSLADQLLLQGAQAIETTITILEFLPYKSVGIWSSYDARVVCSFDDDPAHLGILGKRQVFRLPKPNACLKTSPFPSLPMTLKVKIYARRQSPVSQSQNIGWPRDIFGFMMGQEFYFSSRYIADQIT